MIRIGIIIGSTRPGRLGESAAQWIYEVARKRSDAQFEIVDIAKFDLPLLDEPVPAAQSKGQYTKAHTKAWSSKIASLDAFVFVTPEYNHGVSGALKNAIDFLFLEWNDKAAGFVGYGGMGGAHAIEQMRSILATVSIADVRNQVGLRLRTDFHDGVCQPEPHHEKALNGMLDQVISWGVALMTVREKSSLGR